MRKTLLAALAAPLFCLMLSGCISTLQGMYDDEAERNCEQARDRSGCLDDLQRERQQRRD